MHSDSLQAKPGKFFRQFFYQDFSEKQDTELLRKIVTLKLIIFIGSLFTFILGTIAFIQKDILLGSMDFLIFSFLISLLYYMKTRQNYIISAGLGVIVMGLFYLYLIFNGGVHNTAYLWLLTYPPIVLFLLGNRSGSKISLGFIVIVMTALIFRNPLHIPAYYSKDLLIRFAAVYITIHFISYAMERIRSLVQQQMKQKNLELEQLNKDKEKLIGDLQHSLDEIKTLQGILPICARCKKIRNDDGYWEQVEEYVHEHSNARFSHSICPECRIEFYPELQKNEKQTK